MALLKDHHGSQKRFHRICYAYDLIIFMRLLVCASFAVRFIVAQNTDDATRERFTPMRLKNWKVEEKYDRFNNATLRHVETPLHIELPSYFRGDLNPLYYSQTYLSLWHGCHGQTAECAGEPVLVSFNFCTSEWVFRDAKVNLIADGERIVLPVPKWAGDVIEARNLSETLDVQIESRQFKKLASAKIIEVQIGTVWSCPQN